MSSNKEISSLIDNSHQASLPPETKDSDAEIGVQEEQKQKLSLDYFKLNSKNNLYPQSNNGPLTLLELPTEVLNAIFVIILASQLLEPPCSHVFKYELDKIRREKEYNLSLKTIKNLRLTCQTTNILCSPLLLHSVRVELTLASLAHLEMVSTHPLISKGIRTVRILTSHYNPSFYDSFETFLRYKSVCLGLLIDTWEYKKPKLLDAQTSSRLNELASLPRFFSYFELTSLLVLTNFAEDVAEDDSSDRSSDKDYTEGDFSDESSDEDSTEGDSLDEDLAEDDLSDGYVSKDVSLASDKSSDESISIVKRLYIRAFFRFRSLYEDQERMLQNETFTQAVTSAITRMPLAKTLHIHDRNRTLESDSRQNASLYPKLHSLYEYVRDDEMFIEDLVKEEFGGELVDLIPGRFKDWSSPYCQLLLKLPIAIHKAGHLFENIGIEVTCPEDYDFKASSEEIKELSAASQNLKQFTFYCAARYSDMYDPEWTPKNLGNLIVYLSSVLNTDRLEKMDINLAYLQNHGVDINDEDDYDPPESLGPLFTGRTWPNLKSVFLIRVPFYLSEFQKFLDGLKSPVSRLELYSNYLLSDTWDDALDTLRNKSILNLRVCYPRETGSSAICEYSNRELCEKNDKVARIYPQ